MSNYKSDRYADITPYLIVGDPEKAIDFYESAYAAKIEDKITMPDGRIGHAELRIGDSLIMLAAEFPEYGFNSPATIGGTPVTIHLYVPNVDIVFAKAIELGATEIEPVTSKPDGDRRGTLSDPFGHTWLIATTAD